MPRDRGFALLLVLWSLVLLTMITTRLIAAGRDEVHLASNLRAAASAEMLADAAVHEAVFHLLDRSDAGWEAGGAPRRVALPGGTAVLRIGDESGRVNPNQASEALLRALLQGVGADAGTARAVAASILDWRSVGPFARPFGAKGPEYRAAGRDYGPPEAQFRTVSELGLVLGMTPALLDRLAPHMTVFYDGDPDPGHAGPVVLKALRASSGQDDIGGAGRATIRVVSIVAEAATLDGGRFNRAAVVRVGAGTAGLPYQILDWRRTDG